MSDEITVDLSELHIAQTVKARTQCEADMLEMKEAAGVAGLSEQDAIVAALTSGAQSRLECLRFVLGLADISGVKDGNNDRRLAAHIRDMAEMLATSLERASEQTVAPDAGPPAAPDIAPVMAQDTVQ